MKSKLLVILSTLILSLGLLAQNATPTTSAAAGTDDKVSTCCDHGKTIDGKAACTKGGKDAKCCGGDPDIASKSGKQAKACTMMSKDKDGKMSCCAEGTCPMMATRQGKECCSGRCGGAAASTQSKASCCAKGAACCASDGACCGGSSTTASAATRPPPGAATACNCSSY